MQMMVYKVVFEKGTKAIMIVANGKGEAREKARKRYHITDAVISTLGPAKREGKR
nr:MAG TPA: hypothetical protein [Caudoviricetes sp.]